MLGSEIYFLGDIEILNYTRHCEKATKYFAEDIRRFIFVLLIAVRIPTKYT